MGKIGRPKKFRNAAEKQKAYRERKKQAKALRKSSGSESETSAPDDLRATVIYWHENSQSLLPMMSWLQNNPDKTFDDWQRLRNQSHDKWWEAHQAWYKAGMPGGSYQNW